MRIIDVCLVSGTWDIDCFRFDQLSYWTPVTEEELALLKTSSKWTVIERVPVSEALYDVREQIRLLEENKAAKAAESEKRKALAAEKKRKNELEKLARLKAKYENSSSSPASTDSV